MVNPKNTNSLFTLLKTKYLDYVNEEQLKQEAELLLEIENYAFDHFVKTGETLTNEEVAKILHEQTVKEMKEALEVVKNNHDLYLKSTARNEQRKMEKELQKYFIKVKNQEYKAKLKTLRGQNGKTKKYR